MTKHASAAALIMMLLAAGAVAQTTLNVDPAVELGPVKRNVFGNNVSHVHWQPPRPALMVDSGAAVLQVRPEVIAAIRAMGSPNLRWPGGAHSNRFDWRKAVGPLEQRSRQESSAGGAICQLGPVEFVLLCRALGAEPVITVGYSAEAHGSPEEIALAADLVEFLNAPNNGSNPRGGVDYAALRASYGYHEPLTVTYWQVGNEPYLRVDDAATYAADFPNYVAAMKAADPTIKVGLFGGSTMQDPTGANWDAVVLQSPAANAADFFIKHLSTPVFNRYRTATVLDTALGHVESRIAEGLNPDLEIQISEYYPYWFSMLGDQATTVENALVCADVLRVMLLREKVFMAQYWSMLNELGHASMGSRYASPTEFYERTTGLVLRMFNHHFGDTLVQAAGVNIPQPTGYDDLTYIAAKDNGVNVYLMVINKNESLDHTVTVNVSGLGTSTNAERWHIAGESLDDRNTTSFGLDWADKVRLEHWYLHEVNPTNMNYTFPAHSVTMLKLGPDVVAGENPGSLEDNITFYLDFNNNTGDPAVDGVPAIAAGSSNVVVHGTPLPGDENVKLGAWGTTGYHISNDEGFEYEAVGNVNRYTATIELYNSRNFNANTSSNYVTTVYYDLSDNIRLYASPVSDGEFQIRLWGNLWGLSNEFRLSKTYAVGEYPTTAPLPGQEQNHFAISWDMSGGYEDRWIGLWINGERVLFMQNIGRFNPDAVGMNVFSVGSNSTFGSYNGLRANLDAVRVTDLPIYQLYTLNSSGDFTPPGKPGNEYFMPSVYEEPDTEYLPSDINQDHHVDLIDFAIMAADWQECTDPAGCD